jgi:hypothetical protein
MGGENAMARDPDRKTSEDIEKSLATGRARWRLMVADLSVEISELEGDVAAQIKRGSPEESAAEMFVDSLMAMKEGRKTIQGYLGYDGEGG